MKLKKFDFAMLFPGAVPGMITVTAWLVIYLNNSNCFTLGLGDACLLAGGGLIAAMSVTVLFFYITTLTLWHKWGVAAVIGISCSMILQYYAGRELFGQDYTFDPLTADTILLLIFHILFLAFPAAVAFWQRERCFKWRIRISIVLLLMQVVTLGKEFISAPKFNDNYDFREYSFSEKEKFTFGAKENIIVLVVDCMGERLLKELLLRYPELQKNFRDFSCFDRMVSPLPRTMYAVPALLTGIDFPGAEDGVPGNDDHGDYLKRVCREKNSLLQLARARGFRVEGYPFLLQTISFAPDVIDNSKVISQEVQKISVQKIIDIMLVRMIPAFLKPLVNREEEDKIVPFVQQKLESDFTGLSYDQIFYRRLEKEFRIGNAPRVFKYLHIHGAHDPVTVDENLESSKNPLRYQQFRGSMKIIELLLQKLKKSGLYDASTIVITGDHTEKYSPEIVCFIKRPFEKKAALLFNSAPCRISQIAGSIAKVAGLDDRASSVFDLAVIPGDIRSFRDKKKPFPKFTPWKKLERREDFFPEGSIQGAFLIQGRRIMIELLGESSMYSAEKVIVTAENILTKEQYRTRLIKGDGFHDILLPELTFADGDYLITFAESGLSESLRTLPAVRVIPAWFRIKGEEITLISQAPELFDSSLLLDKKMEFHPFSSWPGLRFPAGCIVEWGQVLIPEKRKIQLRLPDLSARYRVKISCKNYIFKKDEIVVFVNGQENKKWPVTDWRQKVNCSFDVKPGKDGIVEISFEHRLKKKNSRKYEKGLHRADMLRIFDITVRKHPLIPAQSFRELQP